MLRHSVKPLVSRSQMFVMDDKKYTVQELEQFVVWLRKKEREITNEQVFCSKRNFKLEQTALQGQRDLLMNVIHEMERKFDLGFVWDKSLD